MTTTATTSGKPTLKEFLEGYGKAVEDAAPTKPWPTNYVMEDEVGGSELCIRHQNWTPCLGKHQRYDSSVRECHVTTDEHATFLLKLFHSGKITQDELTEQFTHVRNYRVVLSAEASSESL